MGPKKEVKNNSIKRENGGKETTWSLDDPINSDSWRCVVLMAVEKSLQDKFLLKEFEEEAATQARPKIQLISYYGITKIVQDFIKGEVRHKFAFFLNFSSLFQEAGEYLMNKSEIPLELQVKIIKATLLHLKEESLIKIESKALGPSDPIKAMADRPSTMGIVDNKKKDLVKKSDVGLKVRPPSLTKQETELLKRGEGVKESHCIHDEPVDGYFNLYVLLIEFYSPELPLELIKAGVPLHGLICIDTSLSPKRSETLFSRLKSASRINDLKADHIQNFWNYFIRFLWDPDKSDYFRNTIFQVYTPRKLLCEKKERREFIYRELSYLMYDMSVYKRQLDEYLENLRLRNVEEKVFDMAGTKLVIEDMPNECVTVPVILQSMMDAICGNDFSQMTNSSSDSDFNCSLNLETEMRNAKVITSSLVTRYGSCLVQPDFSQELLNRGDPHYMNIYLRSKALDIYYNLDDIAALDEINSPSVDSSRTMCRYQMLNCGPNLQEIFYSSGSAFRSLRRQYQFKVEVPELDYILYSLLMSRVKCPYQVELPSSTASYISSKKNSNFSLIENTATEMKKPQFTVTDGSRHVLKSIPYNMKETSKDFFSPLGFKVVSPAKLKATSAPAFRVHLPIRIEQSFMSDLLPNYNELPRKKDLFLGLGEFLKEELIASIKDFNYLEVLSKTKIINKETELQSIYNCVDHTYSVLHDAIFVAMHNRADIQNSQYETFNEVLKTGVGLRDFFNYILEDEDEWLNVQKKAYSLKTLCAQSYQSYCLDFTDSDFWMVDSIKYQFWRRGSKNSEKCEGGRNDQLSYDKLTKKEMPSEEDNTNKRSYVFEGYNIGETIVQFSGFKTIFYSNDCKVIAELIERLYGDQVLGVHISEAGHTLHLYSYACPEPHIQEPFMFHVTYRNGIIVAFGRRLTEAIHQVEEIVASKTTLKSKKNSSEISTRTIRKQISEIMAEEEFRFDMAASLPNGLTIQTVAGIKPCYIKQRILSHPDETSRLFLPNGDVIKMMSTNTVQIFKSDTSIITAELNEFANNCSRYEIIGGDGLGHVIENGMVTSSKRFPIFQNTDLNTNCVFFRRRDGTNYVLQNDGTLCVKFNDNTKICVAPFTEEPITVEVEADNTAKTSNEVKDTLPEDSFVTIHLEITAEHPDYVTTIYNTKTRNWRLLFPDDSEMTIKPRGEYHINIDKQTELVVEDKCIGASRYSADDELLFEAVADLSVFDGVKRDYVQARDVTGKKFVIEANSNCYTEDEVRSEEEREQVEDQEAGDSRLSDENSTELGYIDLLGGRNELSHEKMYFVIKKDMSGFELFHEKRITKALTDLKNGSVVFTQTLPNSDLRCFVLIKPEDSKPTGKWEVKSILPDPKYVPNSSKTMKSTTYGDPPSWMHPFPQKKPKFQIPERFSCRVFLEIRPTQITPGPNSLNFSFCEVDEIKPKHTLIKRTKVEAYLRKLSHDDQDILREMYTLVAASVINKTYKANPLLSEKLAHYLKMSEYYIEMQEYHKKCIRYHLVPKYFHHPAGMSWLILNNLVDKLKLRGLEEAKYGKGTYLETQALSASAKDSLSTSDVEYNLSVKTCQSFSSLSYHSSKSGQTAPALIETQGVCKCKIIPMRNAESTPGIDYNWREKSIKKFVIESESESDNQLGELPPRVCDFWDSDFDLSDTMSFGKDYRLSTLTFEDLMCLGLV